MTTPEPGGTPGTPGTASGPLDVEDLRARIQTNLRVYQRRVDVGTATDFDRGKCAAFRVVLSMLEPRGKPTFSCGRRNVADQNPWLATSDIEEDDRR